MNVKEYYDLYIDSFGDNSTIAQYKPKVTAFVKPYLDKSIQELFTEQVIRNFIFETEHSPKPKRSALMHFMNFLIKENALPKSQFPVSYEEVTNKAKKDEYLAKKSELIILSRDFDLKEFVDDKYYQHIGNEKASLTVKALISICFATGFDTKELFDNQLHYLKVGDVDIINENHIQIQHENYDKIFEITGDSAKFISEYARLRKGQKLNEDCFFLKLWSGREIDFDTSIINGKPNGFQNTVYYMLKYICSKNALPEITISDMRVNMAYRSLIKSSGMSLTELIGTYGFTATFVQKAFDKFIHDRPEGDSLVPSFFEFASSIEGDNDEANPVKKSSYHVELSKRFRDRKLVKELKKQYDNRCQLCGERLEIIDDIYYSEVHHIVPLSKDGDDSISNMVVLCRNHHKLFDEFVLAINPEQLTEVVRVDGKKFKFTVNHTISRSSARFGLLKQKELYNL